MKNTEQKEPIPFEVAYRKRRIKKIMQWMIPILLIAAWVVFSPIIRRPGYKNELIKMFHEKESSLLREVDIPDEMRLSPELILQMVDEYDTAGGNVEMEETPSGKKALQIISDGSYRGYGFRVDEMDSFCILRAYPSKMIDLFYLRNGNEYWRYHEDGTISRKIFVVSSFSERWPYNTSRHERSITAINNDNQTIYAIVKFRDEIISKYEIPYADYRAFMDAYDSGTLPEGTELTFDALAAFGK